MSPRAQGDGSGGGRYTPRSEHEDSPRSSYSPVVRLVAALVLVALVLAPLAFVLIF
jgi:hypothetical protein